MGYFYVSKTVVSCPAGLLLLANKSSVLLNNAHTVDNIIYLDATQLNVQYQNG